MYLDYSKLEFDSLGRPETPELMLQTLSEKPIGILSGAHGLRFNIKLSEPSQLTFQLPSVIDGVPNPLYKEVVGRKLIYTDKYGIYVTMNPATSSDGAVETKTVTAYSIEKRLEDRRFFLEEGTYNFWNPAAPEDTILGRILEIAPEWSVGYVSPSLIGRYRTFEAYDDYLMSFMYNSVTEKYRCIFIFEPYNKKFDVYDVDEADFSTLPIYLDFDNLLKSIDVEEMSDELITAIRPYGADGLDIRAVNPIGSNWVYDLSYFISNGDIPTDLAEKWKSWQHTVLNNQSYYKGLIGLRASANARLLHMKSELVDLEAELVDLTNQQNVIIQAIALEPTEEGRQTQQELLDEVNHKIAAKALEISSKKEEIFELENQIGGDSNSYDSRIQAVVDSLAIESYFSSEEYAILRQYFVEQDITEESFVASDVESVSSGIKSNRGPSRLVITDSTIEKVDLSGVDGKSMYVINGGDFLLYDNEGLSTEYEITSDIIRGTVEVNSDQTYVMSIYAGTIFVKDGGKRYPSGMITITGSFHSITDDITDTVVDDITTHTGRRVSIDSEKTNMFMTTNVTEYQKYSVQMELFDYTVSLLEEISSPTYEFSVESSNFLFAKEFEPFRKSLRLGRGIYLNIGDDEPITPLAIEMEFTFEDMNEFSLVFSNRFKRHDNVNTLKDMVEKGYSSGRKFDANKYIYNKVVNKTSAVSDFMNGSLDAARNTIIGASNQSVLINGAGINVGGDSRFQLRIVDSMIAMTDDNWQTVKMAIGRFASDEIGEYWGVNAEVIGGKLFVGNNLIIENETDDGVMQFRVDSTGAWLYNSRFVLQNDAGGEMLIDPRYGLIAGNSNLFTTSGTTVTPSFIDADGDIVLDDDGMPENANFYIDSRDGSAYFRGTINSMAGKIGGWNLAAGNLNSGDGTTYVALNASSSENALYAIWAGAENPESAPFRVKRDGSIYAKNGTFRGELDAATVKGDLTSDGTGWLKGCGIKVGEYTDTETEEKAYNFYVDAAGNVVLTGNIDMTNGNLMLGKGSITWDDFDDDMEKSITDTQDLVDDWAYEYDGKTYIDGEKIYTDRLKVTRLSGGSITLLTADEYTAGIMTMTRAETSEVAVHLESLGAMRILADDGALYLQSGFGINPNEESTFIALNDKLITLGRGNAIPSSSGSWTLGTSDFRWSDVYITSGPISTSDRNYKNSIEDLQDKYVDMLMSVSPKRFKLNDGTSDRYHIGFIAQDIKAAMEKFNIDSAEFGGWVKGVDTDGADIYMLRYEEFIAILSKWLGQVERRVTALEENKGD